MFVKSEGEESIYKSYEELALVLNKEVQVEACLVSKKSAIILEDNTAHCTALKTLLQFIGNM